MEVTLEAASSAPLEELTLPVYLTITGELRVGSMRFEVLFPSSVLSFSRFEPALSTRDHDSTTELASAGGERSRLSLSVQGMDQEIEEGVAGYLIFDVAETATLGEVAVVPENLKITTLSGVTVNTGSISAGKIRIDSESVPISACFFYMH